MKTRRVHVPEIVATASFVLLVSAALTGFSTWFAAALLAGIVLPVALFRRLFPQAGLFALALANLLSVYACLYVYFVEANFVPVGPWAEATAFLLPIIAFVAGCLTKQNHIRHLAERRPRLRRQDLMGIAWLLPIFLIGVFTYALPDLVPESWRDIVLRLQCQLARRLRHRRAARLAHRGDRPPLGQKPARQPAHQRRLPRPLGPLHDDEHPSPVPPFPTATQA